MIRQEMNPYVFMKIEMSFIVDSKRNKIVKCVNKCRLTSFRVAHTKEKLVI